MPWTINGTAGDARVPVLKVKRGTPVVLALEQPDRSSCSPCTFMATPSGCCMGSTTAGNPISSTPLQVPERRTARIAFVADNPGKWLLPRRSWSVSTAGCGPGSKSAEKRLENLSGISSGRSSEINPGPNAAPASAWIQTPAQAASKAGSPLGHQAGDDAAQDVARSGRSEIGRAVNVDRGPPVRRGDDRVGALEHGHGAQVGG